MFPIGENNKWGFANYNGETVINPIYEQVSFYYNGLAAVKIDGKFGYIKKDGSWHINAKYDSAANFLSNYASVSKGDNSFFINKKGRKIRDSKCLSTEAGYCKIISPQNPHKYFKLVNGKYELEYKYYIEIDSSKFIEKTDTTNLKIDEVIPFSSNHILLKKNEKFGLYDTWSQNNFLEKKYNINHKKEVNSMVSKLIEFKYDDIIIESFYENEISYAKVRIKDKYGVICNRGNLMLDVEYDFLEITPGWQMALIEYEPNKYGYKKFNGKEFFKRK